MAIWLAIVAALAYLPFNHCHFSASDETGVFDSARSLVVDGDLAIDPGQHIFRGRDGRFYSHFAVGQSVLVVPLVALGEGAAALLPPQWVERAFQREYQQGFIDTRESPAIFLVSLYAPLASGVLLAVFFLFERHLGASRRSALIAAALLGATTYVATHAVFFLRHTTEALAILGALACLSLWRRTGRLRWLALGTLAASSIVLIRVPAAIAGPGLAGYLAFTLVERWRRGGLPLAGTLAAVLGPPLAVALLHLVLNQARWGTWLTSPMLAQSFLLQGSLWSGLYGLLLSPGAGLLAYSPLLLLLPLTLPPFWREHRAECAAVLAISAGFLLLVGRFVFWHGLWSAPGPRYLFALVPLLMLPLGLWLDRVRAGWQWALVAVLAAAGALIQIALMATHWRRTVEIMGYQAELPRFDFLYEPLRSPIAGAFRALWAGEIDAYAWALATGVPGREAQPGLLLALALLWLAALVLGARQLRGAIRATPASTDGKPD